MFKKLYAILGAEERKAFIPVLFLALLSALMDVAGIFSVVPFLGVVSEPTYIESNSILLKFREYLVSHGLQEQYFIIVLGVISLFMFVASTAVRAANHYVSSNFTEMKRHTISARVLNSYLNTEYLKRRSETSGDSLKTVLSEVDHFVGSVIRPFTQLVVHSFVVVFLSIMLLSLYPYIGMGLFVLMACVYGIAFLSVRSTLGRLGKIQVEGNKQRHERALEALQGYRVITTPGLIRYFNNRFDAVSFRFASSLAKIQVLRQVPTYLIEIGLFGGIILIAISSLLTNNDGANNNLIQTLGVIGMAALRLRPSSQAVYMSMTSLRYAKPLVDNIYRVISEVRNTELHQSMERKKHQSESSAMTQEVMCLNDVSYSYPGVEDPIVSSISVTLNKGEMVGLKGASGSGKSTLLAIMRGLIEPSSGRISFLGSPGSDLRSDKIAYLSQNPFVINGSVMENVALGEEADHISVERVTAALKKVELYDELLAQYPDPLNYQVGESATNLSGGQAQRLVMARAFYAGAVLYLLDEPTANLDSKNERLVLKELQKLKDSGCALVISSHGEEAFKLCDKVVYTSEVKVVAD